jgi:hypothetical protein
MDENFSAVEEQVIDVATGRDILVNRTWELLNAAAKYLGHFFGTDCLPNLHAAFPGAGNTRGGQRRPRWPHHGKTKRNIVWILHCSGAIPVTAYAPATPSHSLFL